jgi:phytoene dehydrogenase-like protein
MSSQTAYDAIVVGSGPNGLAAAITLARAGRSVVVYEAADQVGGGLRSAALTEPGFVHDACATVLALGLGSPFMRDLPLTDRGLVWRHPEIPLAHPLDDGSAAALHRSVDETAATLGEDGVAYREMMQPLVDRWQELMTQFLGPFRFPSQPILTARFGLLALRSALGLGRSRFAAERARALFTGLAGHSILPLEQMATAAFGLIIGVLAHAVGWPFAQGGSQKMAGALHDYLLSLGGEVVTGRRVESWRELPPARAVLFDVTPRQLLAIAGEQLPPSYRRGLSRYRYGPGVFKVDWALDGPIPWTAEACRRAGTVHVGGTAAEIARAERAVWQGQHAERPYVLVAQASLFDESRAPQGKHTAWAYCHVPHGSTKDMTGAICDQIERFAPGFRDLVRSGHSYTAAQMEVHNPNYVGGDINGGVADLGQLFTRPVARLNPYTTPNERLYLCSSATPPGGGVHGMSGYYAARAALKRVLR